jgi:hypothetical protein
MEILLLTQGISLALCHLHGGFQAVGQRHADAVFRKWLSIGLDGQCAPFQAPRG